MTFTKPFTSSRSSLYGKLRGLFFRGIETERENEKKRSKRKDEKDLESSI
jgi:hypothetical protein